MLYREGHFQSPLAAYLPEIFPANVERASWRGLFPLSAAASPPHSDGGGGDGGGGGSPLIIHLAGTGDHSYYRRELGLANALARDGVASILLENPFYGSRRPAGYWRSSLQNVSDLFVMGGSLMAECCYLLRWAGEQGHYPLGLSGVSMGGHMASLGSQLGTSRLYAHALQLITVEFPSNFCHPQQ